MMSCPDSCADMTLNTYMYNNRGKVSKVEHTPATISLSIPVATASVERGL